MVGSALHRWRKLGVLSSDGYRSEPGRLKFSLVTKVSWPVFQKVNATFERAPATTWRLSWPHRRCGSGTDSGWDMVPNPLRFP